MKNDEELLLNEIKQNLEIDVVDVEVISVNAVKKEISVWIYYEMKKKIKRA